MHHNLVHIYTVHNSIYAGKHSKGNLQRSTGRPGQPLPGDVFKICSLPSSLHQTEYMVIRSVYYTHKAPHTTTTRQLSLLFRPMGPTRSAFQGLNPDLYVVTHIAPSFPLLPAAQDLVQPVRRWTGSPNNILE